MSLSDPLLLEEVLLRHPKLRIYVMHAGWPNIDRIVGLLYAHPQVYVRLVGTASPDDFTVRTHRWMASGARSACLQERDILRIARRRPVGMRDPLELQEILVARDVQHQ